MTPLEVRARIEALLLSSADPSAAALLSRMPRPTCACGGKLSRKTGKCARCGSHRTVDRYTRADGTHFDCDRDRERPLPQTIQPGTAAVAEQPFEVVIPTRRCSLVLAREAKVPEETDPPW